MKAPSRTLALALSAGLCLLLLAARSHAQTPPPAHPRSDWVSLDDSRIAVFETRGPGGGPGILGFEVATADAEQLHGETWTIVETYATALGAPSRRLVQREWLRRTSTALLCARRNEGPIVADLDPVQTVLELPLVAGATWRWEGTSGGARCRSRTHVVGPEVLATPIGRDSEAWRVENETEGLGTPGHVKRTLWYTRGLGLVAERSEILVPELERVLEAKLARFRR